MQMRNVGRLFFVFAIVSASGLTAVSCGSGAPNSVFHGGIDDSGSDGTVKGDEGPMLIGGDDGGGDSGNCKTCQPGDCGMNGDGCGHVINCGSCPAGETCGNGKANVCVAAGSGDGGSSSGGDGGSCVPLTACGNNSKGQAQTCGFASNGCGGPALSCGSGCTSPQFCGGGGFNVCGGNDGLTADGGVPCVPATTCTGGQNCGFQGDGCGGSITCGTGTCTSPQFCGGGGFNICGGDNGLQPDGASNCKPETCGSLGLNCGPAGDGCGGLIASCGTCSTPFVCGGGGVPGNCGNSKCTGLCLQQVACDGGATTTISGTVYAGTQAPFLALGATVGDPVPNVLVYIPTDRTHPYDPFTTGVQCSQCGGEVSGSPLVETTTAFNGTFTLTNVPASTSVGNTIPVVIQLGHWRKATYIYIPPCTTTANVQLVMPRTSFEGDIPLTAISTGNVDALECVLLKMGVDQSEFAIPSSGTRIQMYEGNGASAAGTTPAETALMGNGGSYMNYDQILFPCWGGEVIKPAAELANLVTYANAGGHFFATHYSYTWLFNNSPFNTTANWNVNYNSFGSKVATVQIPPVNPAGTVFTEWLSLVGVLASPVPNPATLTIDNPRHDVDSVNAPSVDWMSGTDAKGGATSHANMLFHYTFDTPVAVGDAGAAQYCGHVIFSDFHVSSANGASYGPGTVFPAECLINENTSAACTAAAPCPLTPQEKVLEYMIWDLGQCVAGTPTPPNCTPLTCQQQGFNCGPAGDGCGNEIMCGTCTAPDTCGGGGQAGVCGAPDGGTCTGKTCAQQNISCGPAGDGCGNELQCGTCTTPQTCGGGGVPGQCGYPDAGTCQPLTCSQQNIFCGPAGDGCGNEIPSCGTCTAPQTCGGGGVPGQCGSPDAGQGCQPTSCAAQGIQCGTASDGCGNALVCGNCPSGQQCNASGKCVGSQ
jgi:hypothetical protein